MHVLAAVSTVGRVHNSKETLENEEILRLRKDSCMDREELAALSSAN